MPCKANPVVYTKTITSFNNSILQKLSGGEDDKLTLTGNSPFNVELVYTYFITQHIKTLYWHYSTEIYNRYYWGINTSSHSLLQSGELIKCELCGTKKCIELPFEVTKCRKLDQSINENIIGNIIDKIKGEQIGDILGELSLFTEKFSKWCKFNRYIWNSFKYLIERLGSINFLKHFKLEEIKQLNTILEEFRDKLEKSFKTMN
jgi:hypothetical protein